MSTTITKGISNAKQFTINSRTYDIYYAGTDNNGYPIIGSKDASGNYIAQTSYTYPPYTMRIPSTTSSENTGLMEVLNATTTEITVNIIQLVKSIQLVASSGSTTIGGTISTTHSCKDIDNIATNCDYMTYNSSATNIATINAFGTITGNANGATDITASIIKDGIDGTYLVISNVVTINVGQAPGNLIFTTIPAESDIYLGTTQTTTTKRGTSAANGNFAIFDIAPETYYYEVRKSGYTTIATGQTTVTTGQTTYIDVVLSSISTVTISTSRTSVPYGQSEIIYLSCKDSYGEGVPCESITIHNSNPAVGYISGGTFISSTTGTTDIYYTSSGIDSNHISITVTSGNPTVYIPVTGEVFVEVGKTPTITLECKNANGAAITCGTPTWYSSDETIGKAVNYTFYAYKVGTIKVYCTVNGITSNTATITITPAPCLSVNCDFTYSPTNIYVDTPVIFTAIDTNIIHHRWRVNGYDQHLDMNQITLISPTVGTYNVKHNGICNNGQCTTPVEKIITVNATPQYTTVIISSTRTSFMKDESEPITVTCKDSSGNTLTCVTPTWSTGNLAGYVDYDASTGKSTFYATGAGTIEIYCTSNGIQSNKITMTVTCTNPICGFTVS